MTSLNFIEGVWVVMLAKLHLSEEVYFVQSTQ
jgi:hypothetical protein